jgi:hypothetical protein
LFPEARISAVLASLARNASDRLTVADVVGVLRDRAFALLIVLLGLPNCLPMPPPIPLVCGFLLCLVAAQIAAGRPTPWLPKRLLRQSLPKEAVDRAVGRALPVMQRLERWSRPRMPFFETPLALRIIGFVLIAFSVGLLVAPPIIGQIPIGVAACLIGLGLVERDGVLVVAGFVAGAFGMALSLGFVYAIFFGIEQISTSATLPKLHGGVSAP